MQQDATARKRFLREAHSAAALDHPFICHINEVAESDGQGFIVMEYVDGQSVKDRLEKGSLSPEEALPVAIEVAEALEAAHCKGIVHRDIKPANIMLTRTGHAKVMDFGLAKQLVPSGGIETAAETVTALTSDGSTVGTLAYMSPEQLRGQEADGRSDIWALGVTLYEMVSGTRPFQGQSGADLTAAIMSKAPRPLPSQVPAEMAALIGRCLEKDPGKRYQRAGELREALSAILSGSVSPWVGLRYRLTHGHWPMIAAALPGLVLLTGILVGLDVGGLRSRLAGRMGISARVVRLAVLPFANLTGDPEQEYFSDGMTQEMIAQLGRLHPETLSVIARASVMRYKKTNTPIDQIGRELNVDYVLEGSAQREGPRVRITAELIKVRGQSQIWSDSFHRDASSVLAIQSEVSQKVAGTLAFKLLPAEQARLAGARAVNPEAYDAYLKGTQYWTRITRPDLDTAEHYFNLAQEKDPRFAPAAAGLAMVWTARQQMGFAAPSEAGPKAKSEARRALELDDTSAMAHFALATLLTYTDWDFPAAGREWSRAIELDPGDAIARANYSHYLMLVGRRNDAMTQIEAALKADPFNVIPRVFYGVDLVFLRRYEEALAAFREGLRMQPGEPVSIQGVWLTSARLGKEREAVESARELYQGQRVAQACDDG